MKICFVSIKVDTQSGLGRVVTSLARELYSRGHQIGIISRSAINEEKYQICIAPIQISIKKPIRSLIGLVEMRSFIKKFDIVVAFDVRPSGILTILSSLGLGKKVIIHALGTYALFERRNTLKNLLISFSYKKAAYVFVINSFVKNCIEKSNPGFIFNKNIRYVPLGVSASIFKKKDKPSFKYAQNYILTVGAIKPRKGQYKSVLAFIKIAKQFPDLHYILVGESQEDSGYLKKIYKTVNEAGLHERVHFIQNASDQELVDLYSGAKFFVLTSKTTKDFIEGFGLVYLEAALCGITSIGAKNTGAEMAIEHSKSGLLSPDDPDKIASAMEILLTNAELKKSYAEYAHQNALKHDWGKVADTYEKYF